MHVSGEGAIQGLSGCAESFAHPTDASKTFRMHEIHKMTHREGESGLTDRLTDWLTDQLEVQRGDPILMITPQCVGVGDCS